MKLLAAFVLSILGISTAVPLSAIELYNEDVEARNSAIEQIFLDLFEDLRETMLTGSDTVPVLDPLTVSELDLDFGIIGLSGSYVRMQDFALRNLATFIVDPFSVTLTLFPIQRATVRFEGHIPNLDVEVGSYDSNISVMGFEFWGLGDAKLSFIEPRIAGQIVARIRLIGLSVTLESSDLRFTLEDFKSEINGLFGNELASDFVNSVLQYLVKDLIDAYQEEISFVLNTAVLEIGNSILEDFDLTDIFGRALGTEQIENHKAEFVNIVNN